MAVSLPTTEDVRKAREQAVQGATHGAELARTPLLAALGAGDYAITAMTKAVSDARTRAVGARGKAGAQAEQVQHRLTELPQRLSGDELRKLLDELKVQVGKVYAEFAERGEHTWGQLRTRPELQRAAGTLKAYAGKLDTQVDTIVENAKDASAAGGTKGASVVEDVKGAGAAGDATGAGARAAEPTRSATSKAAARTAPAKPAQPKPAPKTES